MGDSTIEDSTFITKGCGGGGDDGEDGGEYDHHLNYSNGLDQPNSIDLLSGVDQPPCEINQSKDGGFDELSKTGRIDPFDDSIDNHNQDSRIMNNNDDNNSWFGDTSILSETIGNVINISHINSHIHTVIISASTPS